jgi:aminobenzoyl-glutamate utilization protein B
VRDEERRGIGSDDIGDVSWTVPTVTLRYPANVPGLPGHNWANAVAMATPIAHKGVVAGAKVQAMTIIDILTRPALVQEARRYFTDVQTKEMTYTPFLDRDTPPPTWMNREVVERYRPELRKHYYDPSRYRTYLEQLGIPYPPATGTASSAR